MADYIYLLENRLSPDQRAAIEVVREVAKSKGLTVFLVGGAVRDLTSGSPVRDLDLVVQGNALKLKKDIEKAGGIVTGEAEAIQALFLRFPGSIRMELGSTLSATYPKPGKPVFKPSTILDDLRRRDFTANAMALSLNEGSYGLLMDPLNGVADIENRELRLVGNYGFIEDPVRMIRAARFMARLGWQLEEKTQTRYQNGKSEDYIAVMGEFARGYETEEIFHEEDPLRVIRRLEAEGWLKILAPFWTSAKASITELERLRDVQTQLELQGIHSDASAINFPLLTAKFTPAEVKQIKNSFPRQGFVTQIEALDAEAKEFATLLGSKTVATPSQAWKTIRAARPDVVLAVAYTSKSAALQTKFTAFLTEWPQAKQKIPYQLLQEMRIVPELPGYAELLDTLFFELMDGKLSTPEEMKAFLEPYSPPAPPPPVNMRRLRAAAKKEAKGAKGRAKKAAAAAETEDGDEEIVAPEIEDGDEIDLAALVVDEDEEGDSDSDPDEDGDDDKPAKKAPAAPKPAKKASAVVAAPVPVASKPAPKAPAKAAPAPVAPVKAAAKTPAKPVKPAPVKSAPARTAPVKAAPAKKTPAPVKVPANKQATKPTPKPVGKVAAKTAPAKKVVAAKPVAKKPALPTPKKPPVAAKKAVVKKPAVPAPKARPAAKKPAPKPVKKAVPAKKAVARKTIQAKKKR